MGSKQGAPKVKLSSFDDLFGGVENTAGEQIINKKCVPVTLLGRRD